jgi:conjugative relaxase-like TrwC/TraI family protein
MLRITPSRNAAAAKKYFEESLTRSDYYIDGQEVAGRWHGKAAEPLGLSGEVKAEDYFALVDNRHPETGARLTPRDRQDRRPGFDFTFSTPKSVSVLYELTGDGRILDAFRESVHETMSELETEMKTRVRVKGSDHDRVTGNLVYADFLHFTSRPVDGMPSPHLHMHCYPMNITYDEVEKRYKAGQFGDIKRDGTYWESAFDARLAHRLNVLGIPTEKRGLSFEVAGVPQSLIDKFSQRRNEIEEEAARKGITDAKGKHAIGYYGREHKNLDFAKSELREIWKSWLADGECSWLSAAKDGRLAGDRRYRADEAKGYAIEHSFQNASTISEKRLKAEALKYAVGFVLPADVADITQHPEVIAETRGGQLMTTTRAVLKDEIAMLQFAKDGQRKFRRLAQKVDMAVLEGLDEGQRKAVLHVARSRDQVTGISGKAGTGKTHTLQAVVRVIGPTQMLAPSASATETLRKEGFRNAMTLERFLVDDKAQAAAKGMALLPDEAGLISSKDMRRLFEVAKRNNNRIILSGDYAQHSSVEAGDAFRLLEQEAGVRLARLTEIRRQKLPSYRKAAEAISQGTGKAAQRGFDAFDKMGWIVESSGDERHSMLVQDYLQARGEGASALIISPTHAEGERLTAELRAKLKAEGAIGKEHEFTVRRSTDWTQAQKGDIRNYERGMVIDFHQALAGSRRRVNGVRETVGGFKKGEAAVVVGKDAEAVTVLRTDGTQAQLPLEHKERFDVSRTRTLSVGKGDRIRITKNGEAKVPGHLVGTKVKNGDIYTVEGFTKEGDIRLEKGKLLPKGWGHMTLGYVDTSYASQGKTVDRVFVALGNMSLAAANAKQWYVSLTRGKEMAKVYVDDKQEVRAAIGRGEQRLSAVELTGTKLGDSWGTRVAKTFERSRIGNFLKSRANAIAEAWRRREGVSYA